MMRFENGQFPPNGTPTSIQWEELRKEDEKVKYCGSWCSSISLEPTNSVIDHNAYDMDSETNSANFSPSSSLSLN